MPEQGGGASFGVVAQRSADRLALSLEEVGFDVGRAFPMLGGAIDSHGLPGVQLGQVGARVADQLSAVLAAAARYRATTAEVDGWPEAGGSPAGHDPGAGN